MRIRTVTEKDAHELLEIYRPYVEDTAITFEYDVPSVEEFSDRIRRISANYPYIAAVENGKIAGYACVAYPEKEDEYLTFDSVKFHEKMGYTITGTFHRCAFKFNKCYHMVWLEKILTQTDITPLPVIPFSKLDKALINKIVLE